MDDFDWVKNTSHEDILDNHFGIESNDYLAWFRGIEDKNNVHPSYEKYNELVEANWSKLYRIIYGEKMYKWKGLIKRLRIGNKLDNWRIDRLDKLEEYYNSLPPTYV